MALELNYRKLAKELSKALKYEKKALERKIQSKLAIYDLVDDNSMVIRLSNSSNDDLDLKCTTVEPQLGDSKNYVSNPADLTSSRFFTCPIDVKNGVSGSYRTSKCPIGDHRQTLHAATTTTTSGAPIVGANDHTELSSPLLSDANGYRTLLETLNESDAAYISDGGNTREVCMQRLTSCSADQLESMLHEYLHSRIICLDILSELLENVRDPTQLLFLVKLGLLNPWTTDLVATTCPCPSLTLLVDLLQDFSVDEYLLERLLLATRLSRDPRLWRHSAYYLKQTSDLPGNRLAALFGEQVPLQSFAYRVLLLYNVQHLFRPLQLATCFNSKLDACRSDMLDIINYPLPKFHTLRLKRFIKIRLVIKRDDLNIENGRLLQLEDHISLRRSMEATSDTGIVNLDFTNQVLGDLYRRVDASMGVYVVGVGKRFHIRELANRLGITIVNYIYLDGSTDYKTLIGHWQCTSALEKFEFTYGILTVAIQQGRWLVFDKTMSDSIAALLNGIVGSGYLYIPETLETICAHPNFNFFVTAKSDGPAESEEFRNCCNDERFAKLPLVYIPPPTFEHLLQITRAKYPRLHKLLPSVLNAYTAAAQLLKDFNSLKITHLLRVCKRIDQGEYNYDGFLSSAVKGYILECFYTVCISGISCKEHRMDLLKTIGSCFGLDAKDSVNALSLLRHDVSDDETSIHSTVLRQLMSCFVNDESVLLVGETGTGKTAIVQRFAQMTGNHLCVYVFNEQSDATDLIGNYYPDNLQRVTCSFILEAMQLHCRTCVLDNCLLGYFDHLQDLFIKGYYKLLINTLCLGLHVVLCFNNVQCVTQIQQLISACSLANSSTYATSPGICKGSNGVLPSGFMFDLKPLYKPLDVLDAGLEAIVEKYRRKLCTGDEGIAFKFRAGMLVKAMTEGKWILLDEINLAPNDLLQRLVGVVGNEKVFELYECGYQSVRVHDNFRLFACMNPPMIKLLNSITWTSGKRALPSDFKAKFTEIFVDEVNTFDDVYKICEHHFKALHMSNIQNDLCRVYLQIKSLCDKGKLEDGSCNAPIFSLRNLVRAIEYINHVTSRSFAPIRNATQALVDAVISTFGSSLDAASLKKIEALLPPKIQKAHVPSASSIPPNMLVVQDYLLGKGKEHLATSSGFIVVPSVEANLKKLCRILSGLRVPILLEGPTATGKTSLVQYLCTKTGHKCIRINNHEHTDVADYLGHYVFDSSGKSIVFNYGPLVNAMIHGHWVILDELNLAPSQVLEALNPILDDNRQVYIPDTDQAITAHPDFMVFATQNPANTIYGGRKQLSRAFCNRFVQIYIDAPSAKDLELILHHRCCIPLSRCQKIVNVYQELQTVPMNSMAFDRQSTFVTLRDLIKWANRVARHDELLAQYGWRIIAEKLRNVDDQETVKEILQRHCLGSSPSKPKALQVDYENDPDVVAVRSAADKFDRYIWIPQTTDRMFALVQDALNHREAVLLVGETGIGKTTACVLLASLARVALNTFSFHKHTEASDFIGGYKPVHNSTLFYTALESLLDYATENLPATPILESCFNHLRDIVATKSIEIAKQEFETMITQIQNATSPKRPLNMEQQLQCLIQEVMKSFPGSLFEWHDGPLTKSMELGEWFLADELNLAEDAVLEKMNSALESPATLAIPEAGHEHLRVVHGHPNFRFLATMNPGGDHGKRELSPALLNRFTIVHVPNVHVANVDIVQLLCRGQPAWVIETIVEVAEACNGKLTLRDLVAWTDYVCKPKGGGDARNVHVDADEVLDALVHGAHVVFLDHNEAPISSMEFMDILERSCPNMTSEYKFKFYSFEWLYNRLPHSNVNEQLQSVGFDIRAQASLGTIAKLVRALAFDRPVLIEGEPGVGKTAAVVALAQLYQKRLLRVNLSEQTDLSDLLGSNIPCAVNGKLGFAWNDGPLASAMTTGDWILLDELNLASQQVLEGLNAILDHRREIFIPELGRKVACAAEFRLFGCQNSAVGGGGRRLLPKSLLNRFTKIYANCLTKDDCCQVLQHKFPNVPKDVTVKLVDLLEQLKTTMPSWEWNLRDAQRFLSMLTPDVYHGSLDAAFKSNVRRLVLARRNGYNDGDNLVRSLLQPDGDKNSSQAPAAPKFEFRHINPPLACFENAAAGQVPGLSWTHQLDAVVSCVDSLLPLPVLITGPVNSGKKSVVEHYAASKGKLLVKLDLYPCCDAFDLLGNFEHLNSKSIATQFKTCLDDLLVHLHVLNKVAEVHNIVLGLLQAFETNINGNLHGEDVHELLRRLRTDLLPTTSNSHIKQLVERLLELSDGCTGTCSFRWVDSQLIEAMVAGHWVLICNVHQVEPAVMDRLIPLMEENGSLRLNESGQSRLVVPHKNFRLFFTAKEDSLDKISRPFRNRCIELNTRALERIHTRRAPVSILMELDREMRGLLSESLSNFQLDCRTLIDGIRMAHLNGVCWNDALKLSLVNCAIMALLPTLSPLHDTRICDVSGWQFLKQWSRLDVDLDTGFTAVTRSLLYTHPKLSIARWCLQINVKHGQALLEYLAACGNAIYNSTHREWALATTVGATDFACALLWFATRNFEALDPFANVWLAEGFQSLGIDFVLLEKFLRAYSRAKDVDAASQIYMALDAIACGLLSNAKQILGDDVIFQMLRHEPMTEALELIYKARFIVYMLQNPQPKGAKYKLEEHSVNHLVQQEALSIIGVISGRLPDDKIVFETAPVGVMICNEQEAGTEAILHGSNVNAGCGDPSQVEIAADFGTPGIAVTHLVVNRLLYATSLFLCNVLTEDATLDEAINTLVQLQKLIPRMESYVPQNVVLAIDKIARRLEKILKVGGATRKEKSDLESMALELLYICGLVGRQLHNLLPERQHQKGDYRILKSSSFISSLVLGSNKGVPKLNVSNHLESTTACGSLGEAHIIADFWSSMTSFSTLGNIEQSASQIQVLETLLLNSDISSAATKRASRLFMLMSYASPIIAKALGESAENIKACICKSYASATFDHTCAYTQPQKCFSLDVYELSKFIMEYAANPNASREVCIATGLLLLVSRPNLHKVLENESLLLQQSLDAMLYERLDNCRVLFDDFDMLSQGHLSNPLEYFLQILGANLQAKMVPVPIRTLDTVTCSTCTFDPVKQIDGMVKLVDTFVQSLVHSATSGNFSGAEILNFAASLRQYLFLTEAYRPIQLGIEALLLSVEYSNDHFGQPNPGKMNYQALNRLLAWPLNPIMRLDGKELLSLARQFHARQNLNLLFHCIVCWIQFDTLIEPCFEPLRCIVMLLAGLSLQQKPGETNVKKSLLQRCIEAKPTRGSIIEILRAQTEAIYSIIPDYKPMGIEQQPDECGKGDDNDGVDYDKDCLGNLERAEFLETFARLVDALDISGPENITVATRKCILATMCVCNNTCHDNNRLYTRLDKLFAYCIHEHAKFRHLALDREVNASKFFRGVDANLCQRVCATMAKIKSRCLEIMNQLECGIDALNEVVGVLESMHRVKLQSLTGCVLVALLEHLLDRVTKFNILIPSSLSLREAALEIETLILQLRHLELAECRTLVNVQLQQCSQESFVLFPALVEISSSIYQASNVVVELFQLVMNSPIVQHATILRQAKAVATIFQDSQDPYEVATRNSMLQFAPFLEQWTPMINEYMSNAQKEAQEEIDRILSIVNYSGRHYKAVAESITKNRRHISNVVSKFTQTIKRPLLQVYTNHVTGSCFNNLDIKPLENVYVSNDGDSIAHLLLDTLQTLQSLLIQGQQPEKSKSQVKRSILNVQHVLKETGIHGSRMYIEHVIGWVKWSRKPIVCIDAKHEAQLLKSREIIHEALYAIVNIETLLEQDEDLRRQVYVKGVDPMLVGQLACMLQRTFANIEGAVEIGCEEKIASGAAYETSAKDYQVLLAHLDECYMALSQASILHGEFRDSVQELETFKSSIVASAAYKRYKLLQGLQGKLLVPAKFLNDYSGLLDHLQPLRGFTVLFDEYLDALVQSFNVLTSKFTPLEQTSVDSSNDHTNVDVDAILEQAHCCRCLAAIIGTLVQYVKIQDPNKEDSGDGNGDLSAGVGLYDASALTSMNLDDNDIEPGNLDGTSNKRQDVIENPNKDSLDVDYDFQGDLVDLDLDEDVDGNRGEDGEEEDDTGHVDEPQPDFKREQLDAEMGDLNGDKEGEDDGGFEDVKGVDGDARGGGEDNTAAEATEGDGEGDEGDLEGVIEGSGGALNDSKEIGFASDVDEEDGNDVATDDDATPSEDDSATDDSSLRVQGGALEDLEQEEIASDVSEDDTEMQPPPGDEQEAPDSADPSSTSSATNSRNYLERPFGASGTGDNNEPDGDILDALQGLEASISSSAQALGPKWSTSDPQAQTRSLPKVQPQLLPRQDQGQRLDTKSLLENVLNDPEAPNSDEATNIHTVDETSELEGLGYGMGSAPADIGESNQRFENGQLPAKKGEIDDVRGPVHKNDHVLREQSTHEHEQVDIQTTSMEFDPDSIPTVETSVNNKMDAVCESYQQTIETDDVNSGVHACKKTWKEYQEETAAISAHLSQQLKIILEPTRRGGLEGSFKSGKRISIRKLIAFIASNYQRDKIWLRRTRLNKHEYRIILALDDSKSMQTCDAGALALEAFAAIHGAITTAQVGELVVVKFGKSPQVLMEDCGADPNKVLQGMTFEEETRNSHEIGMPAMLEFVLDNLSGHEQDRQILVIISDGKFNKTKARPWVQALLRANIVPLLVILNPLGTSSSNSILRMKHVEQRDGKMVIEPFLANFCFQYYALVHKIQKLPLVLADLLR